MFPTLSQDFLLLTIILMFFKYSIQKEEDLKLGQYFSPDFTNWSTCDEFLRNETLNVSRVVDVDWKIFYFWSNVYEHSYNVKFSVPSKQLVDRYRVELDKEFNPPVNWTDAELFMETSIDFSGLFLRTETPGQYKVISSATFEFYNVPIITIGLKIVDPGYLGLVNCKHRLCYAMAPIEKIPHQFQLKSAASSLGFRGDFNRSYLDMLPSPAQLPVPDEDFLNEDDEMFDDEDLEIDRDPNRIIMF